MDTEGTPVQELAAIKVNRNTHEIANVFLGYAYTDEDDEFARQHVHGLNRSYTKEYGYPSHIGLIQGFKDWLAYIPNALIFCNGAEREKRTLDLDIREFKLLPWAERKDCASHKVALAYKELTIPIRGRRCDQKAHSCFRSAPSSPNASASIAKARHGYHCALYDVMELYFESIIL